MGAGPLTPSGSGEAPLGPAAGSFPSSPGSRRTGQEMGRQDSGRGSPESCAFSQTSAEHLNAQCLQRDRLGPALGSAVSWDKCISESLSSQWL